MNFFDKLKGELNFGEEELNKKTIQIRLFYPHTLELNSNSTKLIDNFIVNGTLNIVRRQKGITVFGRILKEKFTLLHECYSTFKYEDFPLQKFILYTPGYHYVHFYTFTKNIIKKINNQMVKENWGLEPLLIDECNIVLLPDVIRYSCILLFNKEDDISIIDAIKGSNNKNQQPTTTNTTKSIPSTPPTTNASTTTPITTTPITTTQTTTTPTTTTHQLPTSNTTIYNLNKTTTTTTTTTTKPINKITTSNGNQSTNAKNKTEETIKRIGTQLALLTETNFNGFNHHKTMFNFERIDHGSGKGTGIAIENRDTRKGHISINFKDDDGRILSIKYNSFNSINILLIYAPATISERNTFIINSKSLFKKYNSINHQIIAGDFNNNHDCNSFFGTELRKIIDQDMLLDTGIEDNTPTFPRSMKRLDRIYCHPTLLNQNSKLVVHNTVFNKSDHFPITITIQTNRETTTTTTTKLERLPWTLCKEILNNKHIHDGLSELISKNKDKIKSVEEWTKFKNNVIRDYLKKEQNKIKKEKNKRKYVIHKLLGNSDIIPKMRKELNEEISRILEEERKKHQANTSQVSLNPRSLPGINHERDTRCKICGHLFRDPYSHLFTLCQDILDIEKTIISTVNKLSFIKIHRWSMETLDISKYNRTERIFPNLIGIIAHQLWKIICHKLFNTDESKPEPKFEQKVIETELLNLIETEKFITLKKIKHDEAILKNTNQDLHKYKFNKAWQTPAAPNPLPI
ncbi:hypothetical protein ACTFIT_005364 [Dictyostelium discoideum]